VQIAPLGSAPLEMRDDGQEARWIAAGRAPGEVRWFPDGASGMRATVSPRVAVGRDSDGAPRLAWRDPTGVDAMEAEARATLLGRCLEGAAAGCAVRALKECRPRGPAERLMGALGRLVGRNGGVDGGAQVDVNLDVDGDGEGDGGAWRRREACENACHRACMGAAGARCAEFAEATAASAFRDPGGGAPV